MKQKTSLTHQNKPSQLEIKEITQSINEREKLYLCIFILKDPSQPQPLLMPSKLLILHGEAKSYCCMVSCVPESVLNYL